jgi:hypothetical protein
VGIDVDAAPREKLARAARARERLERAPFRERRQPARGASDHAPRAPSERVAEDLELALLVERGDVDWIAQEFRDADAHRTLAQHLAPDPYQPADTLDRH